MKSSEEHLGENFDLSGEFDTVVKGKIEEVIQLCNQLGMPISVTAVVYGKPTKEEGQIGVSFNVVNIVSGTLIRMPIEMLVGIRMMSEPLGLAMRDSYRRHIGYILGDKSGMNPLERTDYRAACAHVICEDAIERANGTLAERADTARMVMAMFSDPFAVGELLSINDKGGR
jgi:hypothetical protein